MKFRFESLTLTQLGVVFGVSSHQVGKWLVQIGLRTESKKPSRAAYEGGYVKTAPSRGDQGFNYVWHSDLTTKALVAAGHTVVVPPSSDLILPCLINGPFFERPHPQFGFEVANGDGSVAIWVKGDQNARLLCRILNVADRHGVITRVLGGDGS